VIALASRLLLIALALVAPQGESLKRSPFDQVRWTDDKPQVVVDGKWSAVLAIDDVSIEQVLEACHALNGRYWQKRFEEDLVTALTKCGHAPGTTVTLQVRDLAGTETRTFKDVPMTTLNVLAVRGAHNALHGIPPAIPRVVRERSNDVVSQFAEFARPLRFELGNDVALARHDAEDDLDQLEWLIENRFAFRDRAKIDRKAMFDAARSGIGDSITRSELALHVTKLLARFGDADSRLAGELPLPHGSLPFALGEARGGIVAYKTDRSGFVDAEHPFLTRIDGVDVEKWTEVAKRISPGGAPLLVRRDAVQHLVNSAWLRMETAAGAAETVSVELASENRATTKTIEFRLAPRSARTNRLMRPATNVIGGGEIGYLRPAEPPANWRDHEQDFLKLISTQGLVVDVRECETGRLWGLKGVFMATCSQALPCAYEVAAYRMEPGAEDNLPYLQRLGLESLNSNDNRQVLGDQAPFLKAFVRAHAFFPNNFSDLQVSLVRHYSSGDTPLYEKPVVVLCDAATRGEAEVFAAAMRDRWHVTLIGETTAGANGGPLAFRLEHSGLVVQIATTVAFSPTGFIYAGCGVTPDVLAPKAASDFIGTSDAQLATALDYLRTAASKPR
jgi:hypothetical protein